MKKENIALIIFLVFIVGVGVYFYCSQIVPQNVADITPVVVQREVRKVTVNNPPATTTPVVASDPLLGIDYSSLRKDRLYTEEEGKYANLSEVGQKLLRAVLTPSKCVNNPNLSYCDDYEWVIKNSPIVSLKNGILLLNVASGKGGMSYDFYDLKQRKFTGKSLEYFGTQIRNNDVLIYVDTKTDKTQKLLYYKFGMPEFTTVPLSKISSPESYWVIGGMGSQDAKGYIKNNILHISVFKEYDGTEISTFVPKILREVTFDLSTLK